MKMPETNVKVKKAFDKLKKQCVIPSESEGMIKKYLQKIYDLGHADGYADCAYDNVLDNY